MRIETLEYFLEVSRGKSFTQAARNLYISQQGLSRAIIGLEREMGMPLFRRVGKRIELTEEGKLVADYAALVVTARDELKSELRSLRRESVDRSVQRVPVMGMRYVTNQLFGLLGDAMDDYGVGNNPVNEVSLSGLEGLLTTGLGESVLAVNLPADALNDLLAKTRCRFYPMLRSKIQVMGAKTLLSTRRNTICAEELATLPFVYYNDTTLNCISEKIFKHTNLVPNVVYHASNDTRIRTMLRQGEAATFSDTFSSFARKPADNLTTCEVIPEITVYFGFFTDDGGEEAPSVQYIRRFEAMLYAEFAPYLEKMGCRDLELPIACQ